MEGVLPSEKASAQYEEDQGDQCERHGWGNQPDKETWAQARKEGGVAQGCAAIQHVHPREHKRCSNQAGHCNGSKAAQWYANEEESKHKADSHSAEHEGRSVLAGFLSFDNTLSCHVGSL